jgi:hypothetical protein
MTSRCGLLVAFATGLSLAAFAGGAPASAADLYEPGTQPLAAPAAWKLAITPRVWFAWETDTFFQTRKDVQQSQETYFYPFYGGSGTLISPGGTAYSLTILHGEGDTTVHGTQDTGPFQLLAVPILVPNGDTAAAISQGSEFTGKVTNERTDVEAIAQIPMSQPSGGVTGTLGARYINFQRNERDTVFAKYISLADVQQGIDRVRTFANGPFDFSLEQNFWLGELGFGIKQGVNTSGSIQFFGNLTGMFGWADVAEFKTPAASTTGIFNLKEDDLQGGVIGVDTNAGVAFRVSDGVSVSARYRLFYLSAPQVQFDVGGYFIHGPEVNATLTW